jgi:hypothetical protein
LDDERLSSKLLEQAKEHVYANLQLACSFYPTNDWLFTSARLTVALARDDGVDAPAPIAYSLRPLTDHDGTGREESVEIGADIKFVNVSTTERTSVTGNVFIRGYGLMESVSYWEFTATPSRPLRGSFLLWLIAQAPTEANLAVKSSLQVMVAPRRSRSRAERPRVEGSGKSVLLLRLKDGPPYRAQLLDPKRPAEQMPWQVDAP